MSIIDDIEILVMVNPKMLTIHLEPIVFFIKVDVIVHITPPGQGK
jgi:hypothetical protein